MKKIVSLSIMASGVIFAGGDIAPVEPAVSTPSVSKTTTIDIYGVAHLSADRVDNGDVSTNTIASNSSRIGIKASHDLGNGLTVLGQYETGVDLTGKGFDDGNGGDFTGEKGLFTRTRDSYLGLAGSFGTVLAGRLGAQNQWIYDYNLFADQVGDLGNILGAGGVGPDRASSTIAYVTPTFVGFNGLIAYMTPDSNVGIGDATAIVGKLNYDMGNGIKLGAGYIGVDLDDPMLDNPSEIALSASYTQDMFSVGGGYAMMDDVSGAGVDRNVWHAGASFKAMDNLTLKAHYAKLSDDVATSDADMYAVGVDYDLTKNITAYVAYSKTNNDAGASYLANNWGHGKSAFGVPALGNDPDAISIGLVYKFSGTIFSI